MKRGLSTVSVLGAVLLLLVCTQLINGWLSLLSFEKQQLTSVLSGHDAVGANLRAKIERALRLGKSLEKFVGVEALLQEGLETARDLDNISLHKASGEVVAASSRATFLPPAEKVAAAFQGVDGRRPLRAGDLYFQFFPLLAGSDQGGVLCFAFNETRLSQKRWAIAAKGLTSLALCTLVAALMLSVGLRSALERPADKRTGYLARLLFLVLGGAQLLCSGYNFLLFQDDYVELVHQKSRTVAGLTQQDVNFLLKKGLQVNALVKIDKQLVETVERNVEIHGLAIEDLQGKELYRGGHLQGTAAGKAERLPLIGKEGEVGKLVMVPNVGVVEKAVRDIAFDSLTIVALSLLLIMELVLFLFATLLRQEDEGCETPEEKADLGSLTRTAIFLFIFAASLGYSFIPLHMADIYKPIAGLSRDMLLGLPLALEMLGGGLVLIPVGRWIDKRGWHPPFLTGVVVAMIGTAASGLTSDGLLFSLARLFAGVGYGLAWMSAQGYVLQRTAPQHRARGISNVVAGIFSGVICGNGVGALVADRIGYSQVFLIGALIMAVGLLFVILFMRRAFLVPDQGTGGAGSLHLLRLLTDPQAMLVFLCSLMPYSVVMVGLLYYTIPLYLKEMGTSQSNIGRVIMIFGLCMIFLAPRVSRLADRLHDKRLLVVAGGLCGGCSLLLFYFPASFWVVCAAVLLFGVSVAISGASRNVIMLAMPITKQLGSSQVMGVYRSVDKIGQSLGAMVPPALMVTLDMRGAMLAMGSAYLLLTLILVLTIRPHLDG
jgi:predicted MFS family arabinose efflux permease